jgi:hypothetical protein
MSYYSEYYGVHGVLRVLHNLMSTPPSFCRGPLNFQTDTNIYHIAADGGVVSSMAAKALRTIGCSGSLYLLSLSLFFALLRSKFTSPFPFQNGQPVWFIILLGNHLLGCYQYSN